MVKLALDGEGPPSTLSDAERPSSDGRPNIERNISNRSDNCLLARSTKLGAGSCIGSRCRSSPSWESCRAPKGGHACMKLDRRRLWRPAERRVDEQARVIATSKNHLRHLKEMSTRVRAEAKTQILAAIAAGRNREHLALGLA